MVIRTFCKGGWGEKVFFLFLHLTISFYGGRKAKVRHNSSNPYLL